MIPEWRTNLAGGAVVNQGDASVPFVSPCGKMSDSLQSPFLQMLVEVTTGRVQ